MNPLLDFTGLPRFDVVAPEHVAPAIRQLIDENTTLIGSLMDADTPATWNDLMAPLIEAGERLSRAWGIVGHLHSVNDIPVWREAYNALLPEVTGFYAELGQNLGLFSKIKKLRKSAEFATLSAARQRIIENDLRDFKLSGAELPENQKPRFKEIQEELSALAAKFAENLLDATNAHTEVVRDETELIGIPEDVKAAARKENTWEFTLRAPSYIPVMQYAENRDLRARMYRAYATRASELGNLEWDNGPLIDRLLALHAEEAKMLGYANFAEVSFVSKMAESPARAIQFLRELAAQARPFAEKDIVELQDFARTDLGLPSLESWDMSFASEKLKQARYAFSDDEVKQYFPEHKVLAGLFRVIEALFAVTVEPDTASVWHPEVRFFKLLKNGQKVGQFYLDLHARDTKRGGAWMDEAISHNKQQTPVAYLNCNFPSSVNGRPATFSHDDVLTLFHETGHGLHHLLTEVDDLPVSGIHGVEWDAVELPSQFMENFCWEWDVLQEMTEHVDTQQPLPRALFDKMIAAKNYQSGLQMLRQIEFSLFDLVLYSEKGNQTVLQCLNGVRREVAVIFPPEWNRFPQSFGHIFGGGYAAGYYSYKWAEVLSADAFEVFEEAARLRGSTLDAATGERFLSEILAVGGARPAMESFIAFRGRAPEADALLRHNGMA
ncbi:MAG: M3 family metallopeptidase [Rhodocyclaceae bacterium]|nr:M3 family metallopeptidase [Rhodocyclaceae bacterium]